MTHANFSRFSQLCTRSGINPRVAHRSWELLEKRYSEPHRQYHNLSHVDAMLALLDLPQGNPAMELAIWFHDAVYDPRAGDNEERSARLFQKSLGGSLDATKATDVVRLILATDHSKPPRGSLDESLIRDVDLSILSADPADYLAYSAAIRDEYSHVPDQEYIIGRQAVLMKFLSSRIYQTETFSVFEGAARRNIESEINRLRATPS
jgi:predicted metal-dependent HD superfamily phosphohydrolase